MERSVQNGMRSSGNILPSATPERNLPARYNICPTDTIERDIYPPVSACGTRGFNSALAGPVQGDRIGAGLTARDNHLRSQQVERRIDGFGVGVVPAAANDHAHFSALGRTSGIASVSRGPCSICLAALLPRSRSKRGATRPCYHNRFRNSRPSRTRPHRLFQFF